MQSLISIVTFHNEEGHHKRFTEQHYRFDLDSITFLIQFVFFQINRDQK